MPNASRLVILFMLFAGCSSLPPKEEKILGIDELPPDPIPMTVDLNHPIHHFDSNLPFQPKRIWRLHVSWRPFPEDQDKAMVEKKFTFSVSDKRERDRVEKEILARGGDERYLRWLEDNLHPLGNWDIRRASRIARLENALVAVLVFSSARGHSRDGDLTLGPIEFPEPLLREAAEGCSPQGWEFFSENESYGMEIVLESRSENPKAKRWLTVAQDYPQLEYHAYSKAQGHRIIYRSAVKIKHPFSRCPVPPVLSSFFDNSFIAQAVGIEW